MWVVPLIIRVTSNHLCYHPLCPLFLPTSSFHDKTKVWSAVIMLHFAYVTVLFRSSTWEQFSFFLGQSRLLQNRVTQTVNQFTTLAKFLHEFFGCFGLQITRVAPHVLQPPIIASWLRHSQGTDRLLVSGF